MYQKKKKLIIKVKLILELNNKAQKNQFVLLQTKAQSGKYRKENKKQEVFYSLVIFA